MAYDLIGDIHGCADELTALLGKLGYRKTNNAYRHPERRVVFLGDYIDRGKQNKQTLSIVRSMVEAGSAIAIAGNHEYNALCYHTRHPQTGQYLRPHTDKNIRQHQSFLNEFNQDDDGLKSTIEWFSQLPLYLDLGEVRVVHACWHPEKISELETLGFTNSLNDELLLASCRKDSQEYRIIETLLKGTEVDLPSGSSFLDKDGHERREIRTKWWQSKADTYREAALLSESELSRIPDDPFPEDELIGYSYDAPAVFFGHYWLQGQPSVFNQNIACLDYSVGKPGGALCCYRWSGESQLSNENFVRVPRKN
ncbi:metallophosphoesterase [Geoalkalibacter subterraneus]|uniref:Calcineurin-like phosphoesterase domain-containing protein n=1 Tax=Geoalkalibacter subterraneus TaxID=483547 RepID=A0A0B5FN65_9BACT|nr:metallophosphoesterase [Geoalkalibacter subterraneus]AJF05440.1 hypothetical protein GSUB_00940 [Geoalkalibacter subterraneus]